MNIWIFLVTIGGILGYLSMFFAIYALIEVKAMQKSTHKIEWVPIKNDDVTNTEELEKKLRPKTYNDFDDDILDDGIN